MKKVYCKDHHELSRKVTDYIVELSEKYISKYGCFTISLCGGSSPCRVYESLTESKIDWSKVFIFWGDERFVGFDDKDSNYKLINELLISKINIPVENIFATPVNAGSPSDTALRYEKDVYKFFKSKNRLNDGIPVFDLMVQGAGDDGHTASLFPGIPELNETEKLVVNTKSPDYAVVDDRISFTFRLINSADSIILLLSGKPKKAVAKKYLESDSKELPIQYLDRTDRTTAFIDSSMFE